MKVIRVAANERFGRLTFTGTETRANGVRRLLCHCDCGKDAWAILANLRSGHTNSCGCLRTERIAAVNSRRSQPFITKMPEYRAWRHLRERCSEPSDPNFRNYGGRGIKVCPAWDHSFAQFLHDVGRRPSPRHSIDRINNDGHYEPGNVRWATQSEQNSNKRGQYPLTYKGETMLLTHWARRLGMRQCVLRQRIVELGWDVERALTTPTDAYRKRGAHARQRVLR